MSHAPPELLVQVALPIPLPGALTYRVPPPLTGDAQVGIRVKVPVGKRRLTGFVTAFAEDVPADVSLREVEEIVDLEPVVDDQLLALADFAARYYLAPLGEILRSFLPSRLPPWGDRSLYLSDAGAFARPRDDLEAAIVQDLLAQGRRGLGDLRRLFPEQPVAAVVERMIHDGRLRGGASGSSQGQRYVRAYEAVSGSPEELRERCGRSPKGRVALEYLLSVGRPATGEELAREAKCQRGVLRRLVERGVLREFTQIEHLDLDRHLIAPRRRPPIALRPDQETAVEVLCASLDRSSYAAFLLDGMTGSGKTEVYLRAIDRTLGEGRGAIVLVPEIGLVPALAGSLRERFGETLAILHSHLASSERAQEWERIRSGRARVVLGPRSALFAPLSSLGLIVVDEEHDDSYKQDVSPRYHGRDLSLVRARHAGATAVLVSATPSLESRRNVETGKLSTLTLTERAGQGSLPEGILVDLRSEGPEGRKPGEIVFSTRLLEEIRITLDRGRQIILLRNRRGYSPLLLCRACGEDLRCDDCGLPRTLHRRLGRLLCHYCGSTRAVPDRCPSCEQKAFEAVGSGTERVEERFRELFPEARVDVLDRDTARSAGGASAILQRFGGGDSQVLIGTQMVSKGHHFPGVELTGVLSADTYLGFPDFRAVEKTYALLTQLAGRAGRGEHPGRVVIQTYHPQHYAIQAALRHDDDRFAEQEMRFRKVFHYPPFSRMVQLLWSDRRRERGRLEIRRLAESLFCHRQAGELRITGPAPAPLEKLRGRWRFQLMLRAHSGALLKEILREVLPEVPPRELTVDVDPHQLL